MSRRPIGYQVTYTYCRACAPEGMRDYREPMREGDDHGVPFSCDECGGRLGPCDHEWEEWLDGFDGRKLRFCSTCDESEWRDPSETAHQPHTEGADAPQ